MDIFLSDRFQIYYQDIYQNFAIHFDQPMLGLLQEKLMKGRARGFKRATIFTADFFKILLGLDDDALLILLRKYGHHYDGPLVHAYDNHYRVFYKGHGSILDNANQVYYYMKQRKVAHFMLEKSKKKPYDNVYVYYCELR